MQAVPVAVSPAVRGMAVVVVTGCRPARPDVSYSRKLPTNATMRMIQMYFAALRIDCSTGRHSLGLVRTAGTERHTHLPEEGRVPQSPET